MIAVVMAGGEGSRLRPITAQRPKPLVPVGNRPIMEHILDLLKRHGISEVVATVHYLADEIQRTFGDGSELGMRIHYSVEDTPLGTAGSVKQAEALLGKGTFVIISGDALTDCDLTAAIEFHRQKKSLATIVLHRVPNPLDFGVVITERDGRIQRFLEKPSWSEVFSDTVNTGIYILEPEVLATMTPGNNYDWSQNIFPQLLREGKPIYGFVMDGYWADVGTLNQYREAQDHLLSGKVNLHVRGQELRPGVWVGEGCTIDPEATLEAPVCLGDQCKVKAGAHIGPNTVLGDHAFVEEGAIIHRSVVWDSAYIGPNVRLDSAIVGSRVTIKRDANVQEEAVIGDRCLLDVGATIRPRVKLWPDKIVDRGATLTMSLIWGNKWRGSLFRDLDVAGLSNIEITPEFATRLAAAFGSCLPPGSKVVTSRDSTRSSRMIKRAVIASLLSVGCDVLDLRSAPMPVARHFVKASGAVGAISVRKLPGNARVSLVEMFDESGATIDRAFERKVESAFFREDFRRTDPDDLGIIDFASRAQEEYQADFFRLLGSISVPAKRPRLICDYGYSALAGVLPPMLDRLGIDSVSLNSFNNAKMAPRTPEQVISHLTNVQQISTTLSADMGVLFTDEGERLTAVDNEGRVLDGMTLTGVLGTLFARRFPGVEIALPATASARLEHHLTALGARVIRTKIDAPSLVRTALEAGVKLGADGAGGFMFPEFHAGFDAAYALAWLTCLLHETEGTMGSIVSSLPPYAVVHDTFPCEWEAKGSLMRTLADQVAADSVDLKDGIKIKRGDDWVLALPDAMEPWIHLYAEGPTKLDAELLIAGLRTQLSEES